MSTVAIAAVLSCLGGDAKAAPPTSTLSPAPVLCDPCKPALVVTGASPGAAVRVTVARWGDDTWKTVREAELGRTDGEGRGEFAPDVGTGVYRLVVVVGDVRVQPVLLEYEPLCNPPTFCPPPSPFFRLDLDTVLRKRGQDVRFTVTDGPAGTRLVRVVERRSGDAWTRVEEKEFAVADDAGRAEGSVAAAPPGLFRLYVKDIEGRAQTPAVLYEVVGTR